MQKLTEPVLPLLQQLCALPSWFGTFNDRAADEVSYAQFVEDYLATHVPTLKLSRVPLEDGSGRYSVLAKTPGPDIELLVAVHLDTVLPSTQIDSSGAWVDNFTIGDRYHDQTYLRLGAADNKGGAAALLTALQSVTLKKVAALFYVDEERYFAGMEAVLAAQPSWGWKPKRVLIIEPTGLEIRNTHRGCVEFKARVQGASAHAAYPELGKHAFEAFLKAYTAFRNRIDNADAVRRSVHPNQQLTAVNVAGITCGQRDADAMALPGNAKTNCLTPVRVVPNKKADFVEVVFDIRPGDLTASASDLTRLFTDCVATTNCTADIVSVAIDKVGMNTKAIDFSDLGAIVADVTAATPKFAYMNGYGEGAMIAQQWGVPVAYFGPKGENTHEFGEWVLIPSLDVAAEAYARLLSSFIS
ncbi:MAG: M20/M25/M40 family metallo-hydrolase [bacterium]|nr:M20/M25/M40 family metallo-hydrolase [bacterium]